MRHYRCVDTSNGKLSIKIRKCRKCGYKEEIKPESSNKVTRCYGCGIEEIATIEPEKDFEENEKKA